jgi:hypothetical protein
MVSLAVCYKISGMQLNYKFISLALLLLLLGFGSGYFLNDELIDIHQDPDLSLYVDPECALNDVACETNLANSGTINFSIGPKPILGASPLSFNLSVENIEVQAATLNLKGVNMNMGSYRFEFEPDGNGAYVAEGNIPVCVRNQMQWQADVWLKTAEQGLIKIPYLFMAYKH